MPDRHLNIFHAYRHGSTADAGHEVALEDNVTRALIITLESSELLTRDFLDEFAGVKPRKGVKFEYGLQGTPTNESEDGEDGGPQSDLMQVLAIAPRPDAPKAVQVPQEVLDAIEKLELSLRRDFRRRVDRLATRVKDESLDVVAVAAELRVLPELSNSEVDAAALANTDLPSYLLGLLSGSRPDAWVSGTGFNVLFENKLYGGITGEQIRRHIREGFGDGLEPVYFSRKKPDAVEVNQVPVSVWSWRDVYGFFKQVRDDASRRSIGVVPRFIVGQLLDYLEVIGMGEVKFSWSDFRTPDGELGMLHSRIEALGDELAKDLGNHWLDKQKRDGRYVGVNFIHTDFKGKKQYEVPHWSFAWDNGTLVLFITCEGKNIAQRLVRQRAWLEPTMTDALWNVQPHGLPGLTLRVTEKLTFLAGGKGMNAPIRNQFASFPLELCQSKEALGWAVGQAFDSVAYLLNSDLTKEKVQTAKAVHKDITSTSITGVLSLNYEWNWLELENEGTEIIERVKDVANQLTPSYQAILEAYQRKTPRRRRQAETGA